MNPDKTEDTLKGELAVLLSPDKLSEYTVPVDPSQPKLHFLAPNFIAVWKEAILTDQFFPEGSNLPSCIRNVKTSTRWASRTVKNHRPSAEAGLLAGTIPRHGRVCLILRHVSAHQGGARGTAWFASSPSATNEAGRRHWCRLAHGFASDGTRFRPGPGQLLIGQGIRGAMQIADTAADAAKHILDLASDPVTAYPTFWLWTTISSSRAPCSVKSRMFGYRSRTGRQNMR